MELLVIAFLLFLVFLAFSNEAARQIILAGIWVIAGLSMIGSILYQVGKALLHSL